MTPHLRRTKNIGQGECGRGDFTMVSRVFCPPFLSTFAVFCPPRPALLLHISGCHTECEKYGVLCLIPHRVSFQESCLGTSDSTESLSHTLGIEARSLERSVGVVVVEVGSSFVLP